MLLFIIPVLIAFYFVVQRSFVNFLSKTEQQGYESDRKLKRWIYFGIRSLLLILVLVAIASPFLLETKTVKGNPRITILIDESVSMDLFEQGVGQQIASTLEGTVPVTVRHIASGEETPLGDGILQNLERDENLLVVTDGNSNQGKLLGDIMLLATSLNSTVSTIKMGPINNDVGVSVDGPSEAIRDTVETFNVVVNNVGTDLSYRLDVLFDGEIVLSRSDAGSKSFTFQRQLGEGYHKITARLSDIGGEDYFSQNNEYFKTIKVVPRPRILFVTQEPSVLTNELNQIYDVTTVGTIPSDLSSYLAVIINDLPASRLLPHVERLSNYVSDGNGLMVVGGQQSYDRGNYKGTLLETLLPAKIGSGEEQEKSDVHILVVIDISQGTEAYVDVIKAQAVSVIGNLDEKNNVGVIAFNDRPHGVVDLGPLGKNKKEIIDKISTLTFDGQSFFDRGIEGAHSKLRTVSGGRNILLLTDGKTTFEGLRERTRDAVVRARAQGVKTYVVGMTDRRNADDDSFMAELAQLGDGQYFPVDQSNKLKVLFGEPEDSDDQEYLNTLVLLDTTHFITFNQSVDAVINGYNYLIPKPASRILVTTNKNIPILVTWRFGLGRVVSLGTDDGGAWSGELLQKDNSKLLTKTINWAIGDLTRKKNFDVKVRDTTLDSILTVNVVASSVPQHNDLSFVKSGENLYAATFDPDETGFYNFLGADAAVNYKEEFNSLGVDNGFLSLVEQTRGQIFEKEDTDAILEFIRENSKRITINTTDIRWPFIMLALIVFLIDIGIRRIWENKGYRS